MNIMKKFSIVIVLISICSILLTGCFTVQDAEKQIRENNLSRLDFSKSEVQVEKHVNKSRYRELYYVVTLELEGKKIQKAISFKNVIAEYKLEKGATPIMTYKYLPNNVTEEIKDYTLTLDRGFYEVTIALPKDYIIPEKEVDMYNKPLYKGAFIEVK